MPCLTNYTTCVSLIKSNKIVHTKYHKNNSKLKMLIVSLRWENDKNETNKLMFELLYAHKEIYWNIWLRK